jgi:predicted nuclease of predicted toxin-antitoxin system
MRILADECCPRRIVDRLREAGMDVRYAAESDTASTDQELLAIANAEGRIVVTEDFDFGDLVFRDGMNAPGIVIVFLPALNPEQRADRLLATLQASGLTPAGRLTIISPRRIRQRPLPQN